MNKIFITLLALFVVVNSSFLGREDEEMYLFIKFTKQFNKEYSSVEEFHAKFEIFKRNLNLVDNKETFSPFMDQSVEEFSARLNLDVASIAEAKSKMTRYTSTLTLGEVPESFDWRENGAVSDVKDQGQCGSCWAFSTVANIEGQYAINFNKGKKVTTFSEQELVDCDTVDQGCNGGLMDNAFQQIQQLGGLEEDKDYKYTARGGECKFDKKKAKVTVTGFKDISSNEDEIKAILYENGPLSVAVNANPFMFYTGGILRPTKSSCNPRGLNHGVTLVGYGVENGVNFWIIKNSWGLSWGEEGYIRIERGTGACGVNTNVSTSIVAK